MTQISKELVKAIQDNYQAAIDMHNKHIENSKTGLRQAQADGEGCSGHECFFKRTGVRCSRCKN